ncbi:30S ribosomal protein S13 [Ferroplasma acidiphilum]|jgi:small subunit ribosomal protein S13|uniref:Small ribosomal subunit protein uS13 n=2 Tax=Ferroplasma TaxID=74968 RepID=S0AT64_FERAC|nr:MULTISPECIES: 30S ribosomal protein S13 [Ferroplasma]MCL4349793.1 30S ribosomal protein S13 [Candidatus Thermoplasmatota archaeon]AGO61229.1 30S ribosomal protein S13P [Ferroplasma acidarmanus Fer1]ARD84182.1 30S ribosomal protein S13P [Ferroplasma acidiphilum]NOL59829.1 30S ribosomal protein S13 [Ferroplasma acidiphilum]WMT53088.1 MAG: 30S ribosomal protein S13 [Ferroplasma acidiphilum]
MADNKKDNENFQYIVRIANKDIRGERRMDLGLADINGVGERLANILIKKLNLDRNRQIGDLSEDEVLEIRKYVESKEYEGMPVWLLNHRKDVATGKNFNLLSNDLILKINDDINLMKKMRSYRGLRHEQGHKVRGQRTRSNGRHGLSMGVIRKRQEQKK